VTVVVEVRARFDEAANISLATRLQEAGVQVVYGVAGFKAHAKMLMIVRRERKLIRRYVHLGTGNYHSGTDCAGLAVGAIVKESAERSVRCVEHMLRRGRNRLRLGIIEIEAIEPLLFEPRDVVRLSCRREHAPAARFHLARRSQAYARGAAGYQDGALEHQRLRNQKAKLSAAAKHTHNR
jgi:hypothetical protein